MKKNISKIFLFYLVFFLIQQTNLLLAPPKLTANIFKDDPSFFWPSDHKMIFAAFDFKGSEVSICTWNCMAYSDYIFCKLSDIQKISETIITQEQCYALNMQRMINIAKVLGFVVNDLMPDIIALQEVPISDQYFIDFFLQSINKSTQKQYELKSMQTSAAPSFYSQSKDSSSIAGEKLTFPHGLVLFVNQELQDSSLPDALFDGQNPLKLPSLQRYSQNNLINYFRLINIHQPMSSTWPEELKSIAHPAIICGDFNCGQKDVLDQYSTEMGGYHRVFQGPNPKTCHSLTEEQRLADNIFFSPALKLKEPVQIIGNPAQLWIKTAMFFNFKEWPFSKENNKIIKNSRRARSLSISSRGTSRTRSHSRSSVGSSMSTARTPKAQSLEEGAKNDPVRSRYFCCGTKSCKLQGKQCDNTHEYNPEKPCSRGAICTSGHKKAYLCCKYLSEGYCNPEKCFYQHINDDGVTPCSGAGGCYKHPYRYGEKWPMCCSYILNKNCNATGGQKECRFAHPENDDSERMCNRGKECKHHGNRAPLKVSLQPLCCSYLVEKQCRNYLNCPFYHSEYDDDSRPCSNGIYCKENHEKRTWQPPQKIARPINDENNFPQIAGLVESEGSSAAAAAAPECQSEERIQRDASTTATQATPRIHAPSRRTPFATALASPAAAQTLPPESAIAAAAGQVLDSTKETSAQYFCCFLSNCTITNCSLSHKEDSEKHCNYGLNCENGHRTDRVPLCCFYISQLDGFGNGCQQKAGKRCNFKHKKDDGKPCSFGEKCQNPNHQKRTWENYFLEKAAQTKIQKDKKFAAASKGLSESEINNGWSVANGKKKQR